MFPGLCDMVNIQDTEHQKMYLHPRMCSNPIQKKAVVLEMATLQRKQLLRPADQVPLVISPIGNRAGWFRAMVVYLLHKDFNPEPATNSGHHLSLAQLLF